MKQFQFEYTSIGKLKRELDKINQWRKSKVTSRVIFECYAEDIDRLQIENACEVFDQEMPDALYMGCSTNGSIIEGGLSHSPIGVVCTVCEYPTTEAKILHYPISEESAESVVQSLKQELAKNPWVKAISMLVTIRGMSMTKFCDAFTGINPDIKIFGGGAFNPDLNNNDACVFSKICGYSEKGVVFLLMGGEDLNVMSTFITGWKPLGREFKVTRADGCILRELDGRPANEAYYRYLNIPNDEHFFNNTLEFPFFYKHHGIDILRAPIASNPDGSLTMTSDMEENVSARIAYGDPKTILNSVQEDGKKIADFQPEVIKMFSCAARRSYWGADEVSKETFPFQSIAPTSGFYTSGEFLKTGDYLNQHNVTLVIGAMREGKKDENVHFEMQSEILSGKVSMINRLATFIDAATKELEEANRKLSQSAILDSQTNLLNRSAIQGCVEKSLETFQKEGQKFSLAIIDIDNFKQINDSVGFNKGDRIIQKLSDMIQQSLQKLSPEATAGRWSGEKFLLLLPNSNKEQASRVVDVIRSAFAAVDFSDAHYQTLSAGVTEIHPEDSFDSLCIRANNALHDARNQGRNCVAIK